MFHMIFLVFVIWISHVTLVCFFSVRVKILNTLTALVSFHLSPMAVCPAHCIDRISVPEADTVPRSQNVNIDATPICLHTQPFTVSFPSSQWNPQLPWRVPAWKCGSSGRPTALVPADRAHRRWTGGWQGPQVQFDQHGQSVIRLLGEQAEQHRRQQWVGSGWANDRHKIKLSLYIIHLFLMPCDELWE